MRNEGLVPKIISRLSSDATKARVVNQLNIDRINDLRVRGRGKRSRSYGEDCRLLERDVAG